MDSFEAVVATVLRGQGYWVWPSFKVELTKAEKRKIGRPSSPRWEIEIVAYKGRANEIAVVECKSFLNSTGVQRKSFDRGSKDAARYKLFHELKLRNVVFGRLLAQLTEMGACRSDASMTLCLATGHIRNATDRDLLHDLFEKRGWTLWDDHFIAQQLSEMQHSAYEDDVAPVVAKLISSVADTHGGGAR